MGTAGLTFIFTALTFNFWGLPEVGFQVLSPLRVERREALCEQLKKAAWDIVFLQEVWLAKDREALKKCGYPHSIDKDSARLPLDSGLLTLSRWPLEQAQRLTYSQPTNDLLSLDGEGIARKSAIIARVLPPNGPAFWAAETHLISVYDEKNDTYLLRRRQQLQAFVFWAKQRAGKEALVIGGDFNIALHQPLWKEMKEMLNNFSTAPENEDSCTICPPNPLHEVNEGKPDHLFISTPGVAEKGAVVLDKPFEVDKEDVPLSDHYGWETRFTLP